MPLECCAKVRNIPIAICFIAVLDDCAGQLHLTPLHAVCRMRPNFDYVDQHTAMERARDAEFAMDETEREQAREASLEMKPVMVKFKKKENERSAAYRKMSHFHHKQQLDAEPWVDMTPFNKNVLF